MSENKRSRKYSNLKETKQRTLFLRKDDADFAVAAEVAPKILLKPNKPADKSPPSIPVAATTTTTATPAISIATREMPVPLPGNHHGYRTPTAQASATQLAAATSALAATSLASNSASTVAARHASPGPLGPGDPATPPNAAVSTESASAAVNSQPPMTAAVQLINDHFLLDAAAFTHLHDTNTQFFVVGAIGTQSSGKSTVLNLLQTEDFGRLNATDYLLQASGVAGDFAVRRGAAAASGSAAAHSLSAPTTEGVQMFVTAERLVLLDSVPLLCNPHRKEAAAAEQDDLRLVAFMLNVCQLVLVVDGVGANLQLLRLLQMAELMKPPSRYRDVVAQAQAQAQVAQNQAQGQAQGAQQTAARWLPEHQHLPAVWFVHNFAEHWRCGEEQRERTERLYAACFRQSQLAMFGGNRAAREVCGELDRRRAERKAEVAEEGKKLEVVKLPTDKRLNWSAFPRVTAKYSGGWMDWTQLVQEFRRQVLLAPRVHFEGAGAGGLTERGWAEAAQRAWEGHKSGSYALRCEAAADGKGQAERAKRSGGEEV